MFTLTKHVRKKYQPNYNHVKHWIKLALQDDYQTVAIGVVIVNEEDSQKYNHHYRNCDYPTNVISLEYKESRDNYLMLVGEIILCDKIIAAEALSQGKPVITHYAHMIIHGVLHLQGYDHQNNKDALKMEALEIEIMDKLGFPNPYSE